MPSLAMYTITPPTDPAEFENICMDYLKSKYDAEVTLYGRKGQKQQGVDILVTLKTQEYIFAQCKDVRSVSTTNIDSWIKKGEECKIPMKEFILIVATDRDARIQEYVCSKNIERVAGQKAPVTIFFWDDLTHFIKKDQTMLRIYYPELFMGQVSKGVSDNIKSRTWFSRRLEVAINFINNAVVINSVINPVYELNIASLSKLLGEPSTVLLEKYVQGIETPAFSEIKRIATVLGLNAEWLDTGNGIPSDVIKCGSIDEFKNAIIEHKPTYIWLVYDRTNKDLHFILQFNEYSFRYVKYRLIFHRVLSMKWESELEAFYNLIKWAEHKNRIDNKHFRFNDELYVIDYDLGFAVMHEKKHPAIAIRNPKHIFNTFITDFEYYNCDDDFKEKFRKTYDRDLEFGYLQNIIRCRKGPNKYT